ncbi:MAG: PIG-L family deacetylase [Gemmatimonadota bacterium]|nr:MAG: PIG-L family deacetylase [Gemmatimonadota bacterium]
MPAKPRSIAVLTAAVIWAVPLTAQLEPPSAGGIVALDYLLQRLAESRRVLVIAAHPDDEDTSLLALLSRGYGAGAAYLALSRGEGGQNLIGEELGTDLGLLRSRELEAAREVDGAGQFFTRSYDFGYSRSLEETSRFWPPDSVLKDVVRIVRRFRPHVMVTVFSGTARDGHGQHQAAGAVAYPAFEAAGDPNRFAELESEEGLTPWTPLKLYRSTRFDAASTTIELETGVLDARTGRSIHQIAMESRSQHSSQDMGRLLTVGPATSRLMLLHDRTGFNEANVEQDVFDGIAPDTSWLAILADSLRSAIAPVRLAEAAPVLARALVGAEADANVPEERVELVRRALAVSAGLVLDARAGTETLVPGERGAVTVQIYNAGPYEIELDRVSVATPLGWVVEGGELPAQSLASGAQAELQFAVTVPHDDRPTQPYFLERPLKGAQYDWSEAPAGVRGNPFGPPILAARVVVSLLGARAVLEREVTHRYNDQAVGEVRRPLRVVPAIAVSLSPKLVVWPRDGAPARDFTVSLAFSGANPTSGAIRLEAEGWPTPAAQRFDFQGAGESQAFQFSLQRPTTADEVRISVRAVATTDDGSSFDSGIQLIEYPHIRPTSRIIPAAADVRLQPIRVPDVRLVGYVRGAADRVPEALQQLGLPLEIIDAEVLAGTDLARFDAVVIGPRAYEIDPALVRHNSRLLAYVREGGLLLVQYQQYQFVAGEYAPYPLTISRPHDRVTDENAPVTLLQPDHPAFTVPNRMTQDDWDDWPQERGLYFASSWDSAYTALLEMQDPGRDPDRGALLIARHGEGMYVYTGISFFRALPAGTPGAYKLFLNLLALNRSAVR